AISREMGKIRSEARTEIKSLAGRFALVRSAVERDLAGGAVPGFPQEELRYRAHGVVAVIGPFNFPLHLCHAHVVPALLLGNAVVMKPSEITPLCGERYAEAAEAAGLPPGVLNVVQGRVGPALVTDPRVGALAFTGSWATGRRIVEALLDRPDVLVALEMGGKNCCVVLEDADVRQAAHEIVMGGYLTTGQRCTCTDRVLVHRSKIGALQDALIGVLRSLRFGDPEDPRAFAGPLATLDAKAKFVAAIGRARAAGADVLFAGDDGPAAFAGATLHRLKDGVHEVAGYTDEEIFGPDLCLEAIDGDDEAIAVLETSPYGFAHGVFTQDDERFARYARELRAGILNRNRSTNQASPRLPFSGVKKSGNFRPAGAWAGRNMVYPVAMQTQVAGAITPHPMIVAGLPAPDLDELEARHAREEAEDAARSLLGSPRPNDLRLPKGGELPRSTELLERFYAGNRFVREKKPMLFDHLRSSGPYFVSIDDEPLSVIDSMSQTATIPAGFSPDSVVRAFVEGGFGETPIANTDTTERAKRIRKFVC
ncbi:MAG: aldehyde dehydrogenase family protein, partial [Sandaracinaceae bacterium]|nr:aldehyde dehydrogenase family protein [Sandaracinaceae bacterium]